MCSGLCSSEGTRAAGTPLGSSTWGVQVELGMKFLQFSTHRGILPSTIITIIHGNSPLSNCSYNSKNSLYSGGSHVGFFPLCQHREQMEGCCDLGTLILKEKIKKPFSWRVCYNPLPPPHTLSQGTNSKLRGWEVEMEKITDHMTDSVPKGTNTNPTCSHVLKCRPALLCLTTEWSTMPSTSLVGLRQPCFRPVSEFSYVFPWNH